MRLKRNRNGESVARKEKASVKKLENRVKLYTPESNEAKFLLKEIDSTKVRFERYGNSNLLCGKEGLPRIIATGQWDHANEFVIPGILFLYITGWIGWVGRKYVRYASTTENAFENENFTNEQSSLNMILIHLSIFILTWTPYAGLTLYAQFGTNIHKYITPFTLVFPSLFAKASLIYSPILLILFNGDARTFIVHQLKATHV